MKRPLKYVALGDSLTEGYGVPREENFVQVYGSMIEERLQREVELHNAGVTGATTEDILVRLKSEAALREFVQHADLISLTAGGNDLLNAAREFLNKRDPQVLKQALRNFSSHVAGIFQEIRFIRSVTPAKENQESGNKPLIMRIMNLYNPFPIFDESVYWVARFNKEWQSYETSFVKIVDVHEAFQYRTDDLIGEDMVHPNAAGYRMMAEAADACGYDGL